jgi:hypothetical protein
VPGNEKLAVRYFDPAAGSLLDKPVPLVETRGDGGYGLVPGCPPECHETGRTYQHHSGPPLTELPVLTAGAVAILKKCARVLGDAKPEPPPRQQPEGQQQSDGLRPGDDYERRGPDWDVILGAHGWVCVSGAPGGERRWRRPNKDGPGWSATTGVCRGRDGGDLLRVFSTNAEPFEEGKAYGKFRAYALLDHGGDLSAAAGALARQGYGEQARAIDVTRTAGAGGEAVRPRRAMAAERWEPFPTDCLPRVVARLVREGAGAIGCDEAFLALPALVACAGLIGYTRVLRIKRSWYAPSVLWASVVAESGGHKTPAMKLALEPVFALHRQLIADHTANLAAYEIALEDWRGRREQYRRRHRDVNPPAAPFAEPEPQKPRPRRIIASDITVERLVSLLNDNPRGILVYRDELNAWLCGFTRYSKTSDLPQWLSAHSAGHMMTDRNARDPQTGDREHLYVDHAAISVVGSIQPGVLARALTQEHRDAGLSSRLHLCYPPLLPLVWTEDEVAQQTLDDYANLLGNLAGLRFAPTLVGVSGGDTGSSPVVLEMDADAKTVWINYYNEFGEQLAALEGEERAVLNKLIEGAARFALIHAVSNAVAWGDDPTVPPQVHAVDLDASVTLARWFAREWSRVQQLLVEDETAKATRALVQLLRSWGGRATVAQLHRSNQSRYRTTADAGEAMQALVDDGLAIWVDCPTTDKGGRPTKECTLMAPPNPYPPNA